MDSGRWRNVYASAVVAGALVSFPGSAVAADFGPAVDHYVGGQVYDVAAGDLNGDGRLDVATVEQNFDRASTLLNTGSGTFAAAKQWAALDRPYALTIADLDRDGRLDLAVANLGSDSVTVHRGTGSGRFSAPRSFATGLAPTDVKAADLDRDGTLDLAVVNNGWPSSSVSVLLGRGDGTFAAALDAPVGGNYPQQLAFGDLDRDGRLDIFVSVANANSLAVLRGHGDGRFSAPTLYQPPIERSWAPIGITTGDFNRDGIVDVATTHKDRLWAWPGQVDGTLGPPTTALTYPGGLLGSARDIVAADFDGDGWPDLAVANEGSTDALSNVTVMHGRGDGSFGGPVAYHIPPWTDSLETREYGAGANSLALGDFNGDHRPDLAVGHMLVNHDPGAVALLMNAGSWDPAGQAPAPPLGGPPPSGPPPSGPPPSGPPPGGPPPHESAPYEPPGPRWPPVHGPQPPKQAGSAPVLRMPKVWPGHRRARRGAKHRRSARALARQRLLRGAHAKRR